MKRTCRENPKGGHFEIKLITSLEILLKRLDIEKCCNTIKVRD